MMNIIISGHGAFSTGLLDALHMIFGTDESIVAVPFYKNEGIPQLQEKYLHVMEQFDPTDELLFLVDLFGGTPYNAATQLVYTREKTDVVTGVSLPLLLEAAAMKETLSLSHLCQALKEASTTSVQLFSETLALVQTNEMEDDLL
ncbi:mannose/fructose/sorbose PTS transporter subunit IIA [uncultured Enterococcus sp.]|uniref:mannose/fructose/sorbose PTS transporter subunit IIA n=1 Tax=uncultured Enterococcus sp. TaxID=167972 RepID=UPI0025D2B643|nr:mannose/fructose/sorbose PTS transporter subunit IIA [uncultured Enterococcus sp.]